MREAVWDGRLLYTFVTTADLHQAEEQKAYEPQPEGQWEQGYKAAAWICKPSSRIMFRDHASHYTTGYWRCGASDVRRRER